MPLSHYGVLIGELFTPQEQTYQGNWFHGIFYLTVPGTSVPRRCVTDFSAANKDLIQYRIFPNLNATLFANIMALPAGYTALPRTAAGGAVDYIRSPILNPTGTIPTGQGWIVSDGVMAVQQLQDQLSAKPTKLFVFGEPFTDPAVSTTGGVASKDGMHNVHMNQGDPAHASDGKDHQADDGIWQDGATFFLNPDGSLTGFCSKFTSQSFNTNSKGLPLHAKGKSS